MTYQLDLAELPALFKFAEYLENHKDDLQNNHQKLYDFLVEEGFSDGEARRAFREYSNVPAPYAAPDPAPAQGFNAAAHTQNFNIDPFLEDVPTMESDWNPFRYPDSRALTFTTADDSSSALQPTNAYDFMRGFGSASNDNQRPSLFPAWSSLTPTSTNPIAGSLQGNNPAPSHAASPSPTRSDSPATAPTPTPRSRQRRTATAPASNDRYQVSRIHFRDLATKGILLPGDELHVPVSAFVHPLIPAVVEGQGVTAIMAYVGRNGPDSNWSVSCAAAGVHGVSISGRGPTEFYGELLAMGLKGTGARGWSNVVLVVRGGVVQGTVQQVKAEAFGGILY